MIGLEVHLNGQPVCLAAVGENGVLTAMVNWVARSGDQAPPSAREDLTLHVGGLAGPRNYTWIPFRALNVGDVVEVKIVGVESADEAIAAAQMEVAPTGTLGWFDETRARLRKSNR